MDTDFVVRQCRCLLLFSTVLADISGRLVIFAILILIKMSTIKAYPASKYDFPTSLYVRALSLRPDSNLIKEYRHRHAPGNVWPEIVAGIRSVGILEMDIYIHGHQLMMIVETPADFDWDSAMERLATLPRQQEWEEFMAIFQDTDPHATASAKWQPMERMFHLGDQNDNGIKY